MTRPMAGRGRFLSALWTFIVRQPAVRRRRPGVDLLLGRRARSSPVSGAARRGRPGPSGPQDAVAGDPAGRGTGRRCRAGPPRSGRPGRAPSVSAAWGTGPGPRPRPRDRCRHSLTSFSKRPAKRETARGLDDVRRAGRARGTRLRASRPERAGAGGWPPAAPAVILLGRQVGVGVHPVRPGQDALEAVRAVAQGLARLGGDADRGLPGPDDDLPGARLDVRRPGPRRRPRCRPRPARTALRTDSHSALERVSLGLSEWMMLGSVVRQATTRTRSEISREK